MGFDRPLFVSEREGKHIFPTGVKDDAADEDCVFAAGLMQAEAITGNALPATLREAERMRAAAGLGPFGPSNSDHLIKGMQARYGFAPRKVAGFGAFDFDSFWEQLKPGMCATAGGFISNLSSTHVLAEFLPGFKAGHRVYIQRESDADEVWWMDPEGLPVASYKGVMAKKKALAKFMENGSGATIDQIGRLKEPMVTILDRVQMLVTTKPGAQYVDLNGNEVSDAITETTRMSPYGIRIRDDPEIYRVIDVHSQTLDVFRLLAVKAAPGLVTVEPIPSDPAPPPDIATARLEGMREEWDRQFGPDGLARLGPAPRP